MLRRNGVSDEQLEAIARDHRTAGLPAAEVAMMDFAQAVTLRAHAIRREDVDALRAQGFSDAEILDIALAAAARNFFSKVLDAVGAEPDARYRDELPPGVRRALAVGRPYP